MIAESIAELALAIKENKHDLSEIENRKFFQRLVTNNTRDLAHVMIKQNDTISTFLTIVQGVVFLSMNNIVILGGIMESLKKHESTNDFRDNQYMTMAKDFLGEAIKSAQRTTENEQQIVELKDSFIQYYKNQTNHQKLLTEIKKELKNSKLSETQQNDILRTLKERQVKQDYIDKKQNDILSDLKVELSLQAMEDKRQTEIIHFVKEEMLKQSQEDNRQEASIRAIEKQLHEKRVKLLLQEQEDKRQEKLIDAMSEEIKEMYLELEKLKKEIVIKSDMIDENEQKLKEQNEQIIKKSSILEEFKRDAVSKNTALQQQLNENTKKQKRYVIGAYAIGSLALILSFFQFI